MGQSRQSGFDVTDTFFHLVDGGGTAAVEVDDEFWARIGERVDLQEGRLMGTLRTTKGLSHWERHPAGDEVLYLISGRLDVEMEEKGAVRTVALEQMTACVVPRGVWHRIDVHEAGTLIFMTPGKGTEHRSG